MAMYTPVRLNLRKDTVERVGWLQERLNSQTRTDAVVTAIEIAQIVVRALADGGRVIIEEKGQEPFQVRIPSLQQ